MRIDVILSSCAPQRRVEQENREKKVRKLHLTSMLKAIDCIYTSFLEFLLGYVNEFT